MESAALVEPYRFRVGPGYRQADSLCAVELERLDPLAQQLVTETFAFGCRGHAELRDVPLPPSPTKLTSTMPASQPRCEIERNERAGLEKRAAAGKLHDVIDKLARPIPGTVLIVDPAVDVIDVGKCDCRGRGFVVVFGPGFYMEVSSGRADRQELPGSGSQ